MTIERIEAYKTSDGSLERSITRAAAHEMQHKFSRANKDVSFSACLAVIEARTMIEDIFKQMDDHRNANKE